MAEEQAPTEHSHHQRLNENNTKRKRPSEEHVEDVDGTQMLPKRQLRHRVCDLSLEEKKKEEKEEEAQQRLPERDNGSEKKPRKKANRYISEQALRELMQQALDTGSLAGLHPTARLVGDSITFNRVSIEVFDTLSALLSEPSIPRPRRLKVDFNERGTARGATSGRLTITMPKSLHETFGSFSKYVEQDMIEQGFLPGNLKSLHNIIQTGGSEIKFRPGGDNIELRGISPDSSLAIMKRESPFLVVECAHKQRPQHVITKAQNYICGAVKPVNFVIAIYVDTVSSAEDAKLEPGDTVSVSVYTPLVVTTPEGRMRRMTAVIEHHQVFPTPATETFTIKWSDVNCGSWKSFAARNKLNTDSPEPECIVSLAPLSELAQEIAGFNPADEPGSPLEELPGLFVFESPEPTIPSTEASLPGNDARSFGSESYVPPSHDPSSDL